MSSEKKKAFSNISSSGKKKFATPTFDGPIEQSLYYRKEYKIGDEKISRAEALECNIPIYKCDPHLPTWSSKCDNFLEKTFKNPIKKGKHSSVS